MRVRFELGEALGGRPVKRARYAERQPHEDKVTLRVNRRFIMAVYEDCLEDTFTHWQRKGFRPGRVPASWRPKVMEEVREFVCSQIAHYAFDQVESRLDPQPMTPPQFRWVWWQTGKDFIVRVTYLIQPHIPDPMEMFNLEIPLEDNPFELPGQVTGAAARKGQATPSSMEPTEVLGSIPDLPDEMRAMLAKVHLLPVQRQGDPATGIPAAATGPVTGPPDFAPAAPDPTVPATPPGSPTGPQFASPTIPDSPQGPPPPRPAQPHVPQEGQTNG